MGLYGRTPRRNPRVDHRGGDRTGKRRLAQNPARLRLRLHPNPGQIRLAPGQNLSVRPPSARRICRRIERKIPPTRSRLARAGPSRGGPRADVDLGGLCARQPGRRKGVGRHPVLGVGVRAPQQGVQPSALGSAGGGSHGPAASVGPVLAPRSGPGRRPNPRRCRRGLPRSIGLRRAPVRIQPGHPAQVVPRNGIRWVRQSAVGHRLEDVQRRGGLVEGRQKVQCRQRGLAGRRHQGAGGAGL